MLQGYNYLNHIGEAVFDRLGSRGRDMVQINSISKAEAVKQQSRQLRGRIARNLAGILSKRLILANAKIDLLSAY